MSKWTPAQRKYASSLKGKEARKRYQQSEKGRASRKAYLARRRAKLTEAKQEKVAPVKKKEEVSKIG
jgi:hypothetical protein